MTDQEVVQDDVVDDFAAGFEGEPDVPTEGPELTQEPEQTEAPAPEYAQITKDEYQDLLAKAARIDEIKAAQDKGLSTAFGKIGGIERTLNQLRETQSATGSVSVHDEDYNKLEYPDVVREVTGFLKDKIRVQVPQQGQPFDPAQYRAIAKEEAEAKAVATHREILDGQYEGWQEIVGTPVNGVIPQTEYRTWLATQPADYQTKISASNNAFEIGKSIKAFKDAQAKANAAATRTDRIKAAVTPRGTGGHAPAASEDDDFNAGFNTG